MTEVGWEQAAAWRAARHRLDRRALAGSLLDVASALCGLHAQLMTSAELTAWARVEDLARDDVARALWEERTLVKTWAMRGTLHLVAAADHPLLVAALRTYRHHLRPSWGREFGVAADEMDDFVATVGRALDGRFLTRAELAAEVARLSGRPELGEALRESWGALLKPAAFRGELCFAPGKGQNVRFTRPASWLGDGARPDPRAALREVVLRFVAHAGPVAPQDLARWWSGLSVAQARRLLEELGSRVERVTLGGAPAWVPAGTGDEVAAAAPSGSVRLLPAFDQYVVAATGHAERLMPGPLRARVYRPQGWLSPVLCVDGRIEGVWRHEAKGRRLRVAIEPFRRQPAAVRRAAEDEAARLAAFLGGALSVAWEA